MPYLQQRIPDAIEATDTATDDGRCPTAEKGSGLPTALPRGPGADSTVIWSASNRTSHSAGGAIGWRTGTRAGVSA
jgi:hypothetical protein